MEANRRKRGLYVGLALLGLGGVVLLSVPLRKEESPSAASQPTLPSKPSAARACAQVKDVRQSVAPPVEEPSDLTEEEKRVEAFDALVDEWAENTEVAVTIEDIAEFVRQFARLPKKRKPECLQRALNLIPDENVGLLTGVLMDKTQDRELLEMVFTDILNRDDSVKKPILQEIHKDEAHPCWSDADWIFEVTGEAAEVTDS